MSGLQRVLKTHGRIKVGDIYWCWDYKNDCPRKESEMTETEIKANKKYHKEKGLLRQIGIDKVEYGPKREVSPSNPKPPKPSKEKQ